MKARSLTIGAALAAAAALSAPVPAAAQDFFSNVFSAIGIGGSDKEPIEYRERAPLVVPPKTDLRQPQAPASARNAAWPNDPDVVARRQAAAERNEPVPNLLQGDSRRLTPTELHRGPRTATNNYTGKALGDRRENDNSELVLNPMRQLRTIDAQREQTSLNNLRPGEEPERKSLSEPPTGYRKPTEIVRAPNDPVKAKRDNDSGLFMDFLRGDRRNN